jgi:D-alanyl-D-alanine carboxypeptidase/D-alanyl-D-alanine-endopeptidase (penicillin-binding protein 4)
MVASLGPALAEARNRDPVADIMNQAKYQHSRWGLLVTDLSTGKTLRSLNPDQYFVPGSNAKLFSLSTAWDVLGPDHRFTTPVFRQGTMGGSTLDGNLVLVAQGDLTMGGRTKPDGTVDFTNFDHNDANALPGFGELTPEDPLAGLNDIAAQVKASGIDHVNGDVVIDDRLFAKDTAQNAQQPTYPIIINDNLIDIVVAPTTDGKPATFDYRPKTAAYTVEGTVHTVANGSPISLQATTSPTQQGVITISGQVPEGWPTPIVHTFQVEDPPAFARTALIEALDRAGVTVSAPTTGPNPDNLLPPASSYDPNTRVAAYVSPVFSEYVELILKVSLNMGANLSVCLLAVEQHQTDCLAGPASIADFLTRAGIDPGGVALNDGQGAATNDLYTPETTVDLLTYWTHRPDFDRFRATLPVLGVDGSLAIVETTSPAKGHVAAKTGTLAGGDFTNDRAVLYAKALAGYVDARDGRHLAFTAVVNNSPLPPDPTTGVLDANNDLGAIAAAIWNKPKG